MARLPMLELGYGLALLLAIAIATYAPKPDRTSAIACSLLMAASWLLYNAPWHGWGFARATGISLTDAWSFQDTMIALATLGVHRLWGRPWVLGMFGLFCYQVVNYQLFAWYGKPAWDAIEASLDMSFIVQLTIIATVGGRGIGDALAANSGLRNARLFLR